MISLTGNPRQLLAMQHEWNLLQRSVRHCRHGAKNLWNPRSTRYHNRNSKSTFLQYRARNFIDKSFGLPWASLFSADTMITGLLHVNNSKITIQVSITVSKIVLIWNRQLVYKNNFLRKLQPAEKAVERCPKSSGRQKRLLPRRADQSASAELAVLKIFYMHCTIEKINGAVHFRGSLDIQLGAILKHQKCLPKCRIWQILGATCQMDDEKIIE